MQRPHSREDVWDAFVDELDRLGQVGRAADAVIPNDLHPEAPAGKRFGDLTPQDIDALTRIGFNLGRRGDIVKDIWRSTRQQLKAKAREDRRPPKI